jgi:Na+/melibiose symporter-like transporter
MTPIVGLLSDKYNTRWGKRYPWYVVGTIIVFPTFLGVYGYPDFVNARDSDGNILYPSCQNLWYITLPALFNVGWAMVQISHMSIVNSLSLVEEKRDIMVNQRNGFTYAANITVLSAALVIFSYVPNQAI